MSKIKHILSVIQYTICGAVCFQFTHLLCDDWENIYTLSHYHHQIGSVSFDPLFRVRSWNNGMRCISFYVLTNHKYSIGKTQAWTIQRMNTELVHFRFCVNKLTATPLSTLTPKTPYSTTWNIYAFRSELCIIRECHIPTNGIVLTISLVFAVQTIFKPWKTFYLKNGLGSGAFRLTSPISDQQGLCQSDIWWLGTCMLKEVIFDCLFEVDVWR